MLFPLLQISIDALVPPVVSLVAFATIGGVIWAMARRFTILELKQSQAEAKQNDSIQDLHKQMVENTTALREKITKAETDILKDMASGEVETKENTTKAIINQHERLEVLQKQIDATKSDVKDMSSRITVVDTKAKHFEEELKRLCEDIERLKTFFADWIQRVEDRIKETNNYIFRIVSKHLNDDNGNEIQ